MRRLRGELDPAEAATLLRSFGEMLAPLTHAPWTAVVDFGRGEALLAAGDAVAAERAFAAGYAKVEPVAERSDAARLLAEQLADLCRAQERHEETAHWSARAARHQSAEGGGR